MKKFLIIDDDELTLQLYDLLLEDIADISYKTSASGTEALQYLEGCSAQEWPGFLFVDLHMPDMSGFEFVEKFLAKFMNIQKECKLYILTSSVSHRDQDISKQYPVIQGFISKPLTMESLEKVFAQDLSFIKK